jgi:hypothetical protein
MAQIIKHRRGSLEALSAVTSSLQKGELVIASGSSNLTVTNGSSLVFVVPENGQVQATNRFLMGDAVPNSFAGSTYNGLVKGVPYYASGSSTLFLLGTDGNEAINLVGNIQPFSSSVAASINALSASIGSGTIGNSVSLLSSQTGSYATTGSNVFIGNQTITGSINVKDSAATFSIVGNNFSETYLQSNGALVLQAGGGGVQIKSNNLEVQGTISGTTISGSSITGLGNATEFSTSVDSRFSASVASITSLSASVASVTGDFSSSVATSFSASAASQTVLSQSVSASFASVATEQSTQDDRLDAIEAVGLTYATTGSNIFYGTQTITGSLFITQNLVVQGSSSLVNVTASAVDIGTNIIELNTASPAVRFGGVSVADSGSFAGVSGSLLWDSFNNHWLYVQPSGSGEEYNSAILIAGPKNTGTIGDETTITSGSIQVALGENHIGDSIITQNVGATKITVDGGLGVSGSLIVNEAIVGTGSIFLQPDITDSRKLEIYNTAPTDVHIKSTGGLTFLGDDTNYVKIDDSLQTVTVVGVNGVFIETALNVTGPISSSAGFSGSIEGIGNVSEYSSSVSASLASIVANVGSGVGVSIENLNAFSSSALDRLSQLETNSGSQASQLSNLESFSGSQETKNSTLSTYTASVDSHISNVNSYTSSNDTTNSAQNARLSSLEAFSGSQETKDSTLATYTASVDTQLSQLNADSASQAGRISSLETFSGSQNTKDSTLATYTASIDVNIANIHTFTSSFGTTFSSSVDSRLDTLEGTGTIQGVGTGNNVTFAKVTTTGDVVVGGDLVVQGNTVSLNASTLTIEDKLITLASGSTSSATSDGAGFEIEGAGANFVYQHSTTAFTSSIAVIAPAVTSSFNLGTAAGNTKRLAFRNTTGNLDLVTAPSTNGDLLQWNGTDFVMSNTVDGGSF